MTRVVVDPVTRLEEHLKLELGIDDTRHVVDSAQVTGSLYRGFETIVLNRDPRDAAPILSAICGVCHSDHHIAAVRAVENAAGMTEYIDSYSAERTSLPKNAVLSRNIIAGADWAYSHAVHLLALAGPDYGMYGLLTGLPRTVGAGSYADLLRWVIIPVQQYMHQTITLWGGKSPHQRGSIPGGNPVRPTAEVVERTKERVAQFRSMLDMVAPIVWNNLTANADSLGKLGPGTGAFLSMGGFPDPTTSRGMARMPFLIPRGVSLSPGGPPSPFDPARVMEGVDSSWYNQSATAAAVGEQPPVPDMSRTGAYTWGKKPTYDGVVCECGPLARLYVSGLMQRLGTLIRSRTDAVRELPINPRGSVFDRMTARLLELVALIGTDSTEGNLQMLGESTGLSLADVLDELGIPTYGLMEWWLDSLDIGSESYNPAYVNPRDAEGIGLWEAPRGSLMHWVRIGSYKISDYQVVAPTTWNAAPGGPLETALVGTPVGQMGTNEDLRATAHVVRSFDLCGACNVHLIDTRGNERYLRVA